MNKLEDDIYPFLLRRVKDILMHSALDIKREWTVQGFGMMRTYLDPDKTWRLNIYHPDLAVPNVSVHHNHPWSFTSWVLGGELTNTRYHWAKYKPLFADRDEYVRMHGARIMTGIKSNVSGPGEGGVEPQFDAWLLQDSIQRYDANSWYNMSWDEVHKTEYTPGCVTINRRIVEHGTGEHADVFWPHGTDWVSAKPRFANPHEVEWLTKLARDEVEKAHP